MLLVLLSCLWLSAGALEHASAHDTPSNRLRRREGATPENVPQKRRNLNEFVPSFSKEDKSLVETKMPNVTLLLRGLDGSPLGDKSYAALQTAMNDYLRKRFEDYFEPRYVFHDVWTEVTNDVPYEDDGASGGNAVTMETHLSFRDPTYVASEYELDDLGVGKRQRMNDQPTFRASDLYETPAPEPQTRSVAEVVPSELELEIAAGYAFNDLSSFYNHVLVAATIENLFTFTGMEKIDSLEQFPTSFPSGEEISIAEDEEGDAQGQPPNRGDVQAPSNGGLNVAAASSALKDSGTDRLNPLWPALIVGIGVFLFTIIVLGYRKHKARQRDPYLFNRGKYNKTKDNVMIHIINDSSTLEGDEEIEVEDTLYTSSPENSPDRKQQRKKKERELDKEYATSCLKPTALGIASTPPPSESDEDEDQDKIDGEGRKNCLGKISSRRRARRSLGEQDSMSYSVEISEYPRRVDLTAEPDSASWRNPAQIHQAEGSFDNGDMSKKERKRFTKYIQSGLTIEEASSQIMNERKAKSANRSTDEEMTPPSSMTQTRSGYVGGYTHHKNGHRGQYNQVNEDNVQSSPMGCFTADVCGDENLHTETMEDGTGVHYKNNNNSSSSNASYMSLGDACSANDPNLLRGVKANKKKNRNIDGTARAMVITEASSYASSYDDDEFDRAMAEAEAETAFI